MIHNLTGFIHTAAASIAILIGTLVFFRPKGGPVHRMLGYVYSLCMLTVVVTSFSLYRLTGGFNFQAAWTGAELAARRMADMLK